MGTYGDRLERARTHLPPVSGAALSFASGSCRCDFCGPPSLPDQPMTCCGSCGSKKSESSEMDWGPQGFKIRQDETFMVPATSEFAGWKSAYSEGCGCGGNCGSSCGGKCGGACSGRRESDALVGHGGERACQGGNSSRACTGALDLRSGLQPDAHSGIEFLADGTWDCGYTGGEWSPGGCDCSSQQCEGTPCAPTLPDYEGDIWASGERSVADERVLFAESAVPDGWLHTGYLTIDPSCKGFRLSVIPEDDGPATPGTAGTTVAADGFRLEGKIYKIDGTQTVRIKCVRGIGGYKIEMTWTPSLVVRLSGKPGLSEVPAGTFGGPPKEPAAGDPDPLVQ